MIGRRPQACPSVVHHILLATAPRIVCCRTYSETETANEIESAVPLALAAALAFASSALAKEDKPGTDWIPAEQVKQNLMDAGYSSITELEADDEHLEGEGLKNGVKMEFHVDPKTGAITKEKPDKD